MKIHKPTIESLAKEARGVAYIIATVEKSTYYIEHFFTVTSLNESGNVLQHRTSIASHLKHSHDEYNDAVKKSAEYEENIKQFLKQSGLRVLPGVIEPDVPLTGETYSIHKKEEQP